jgi:hypothetical protein
MTELSVNGCDVCAFRWAVVKLHVPDVNGRLFFCALHEGEAKPDHGTVRDARVRAED